MAALHGVAPGRRVVVVASTDEGVEHLRALVAAGTPVVAALVPSAFVDDVPRETEAIVDGELVEARGHGRLRSVVVRERGERRADRVRRARALDGSRAARRARTDGGRANPCGSWATRRCDADEPPAVVAATVCLCEDVSLHDAEQAWAEGYRSAEILKRYTTATMGPCQGAMCGRALACFARDRADARRPNVRARGRRRARPCGRSPWRRSPAPVHEVVEKRTGLHDVHLAAGATGSGGRAGGSARSRTATRPRSTARCASASA